MKIHVKEDSDLIRLLEREFSSASRTTVRKMLKHGQIRLNGKTVTRGDQTARAGDEIEYLKSYRQPEQHTPFRIVFEDEYLLVSDKPAGLLTIGYTKDQGETSFYKEWLEYYKGRSRNRERIYIVHRLDKEVSGLVVFARNGEVQKSLKDNWHMNTKLYYALVEGKPAKAIGKISSYLAEGNKEKMISTNNPAKGKLAITHYRIMKEFPGYTLLEVRLETGRKNQIRVHLAELGCPIVGDHRYGAKDPFRRRIRLHAFHLSLSHPVTGDPLQFHSPMPKGFTLLRAGDEHYK